MTERIDHAERAAALITPPNALSTTDSLTEKRIAAAHVHATLALVEQQRVANLIAYAADVDVIRDGNYDVNVSIRKALGLT